MLPHDDLKLFYIFFDMLLILDMSFKSHKVVHFVHHYKKRPLLFVTLSVTIHKSEFSANDTQDHNIKKTVAF